MTPILQSAVTKYFLTLRDSLESSIRSSMLEAYRIAAHVGKVPTEPDFVGMLLLFGISRFGNDLNAICSAFGGSARISSVFCHRYPQVTHSGGTCELGDLLIAHFHTDSTGAVHRNAMLLQAKMSATRALRVGVNEKHQLALYTNWGHFKYVRTAPSLNGQSRDIRPHHRHSGAQYLLIDSSDPALPSTGLLGAAGTFSMAVSMPSLVMQATDSLAIVVLRLLVGSSGGRFLDQQAAVADNGFSQMVWDLLRYGAAKAFNQTRVGIRGQRRQQDVPLALVSSFMQFRVAGQLASASGVFANMFGRPFENWIASNGGDGPPSNVDVPDMPEDESGGPSILLIETTSN